MQVREIETRWTIFLGLFFLFTPFFWRNRVLEFCAMAGGGFEMEIVIASLREKGGREENPLQLCFIRRGGIELVGRKRYPEKEEQKEKKNRETE